MSKFLYRFGRASAARPWRVIGAWLLVAVVVFLLNGAVGGPTRDDFSVPGTEAQRGVDLLDERFPSEGGSEGRVVFADPDGDITDDAARATVESTLAELAAGPNVVSVSDPFDPTNPAVSPGGDVALATIRYSVDPPGADEGRAALEAVDGAHAAGLQAELSRSVVQGVDQVEGSEAIGLAVALVVLLIAFGSVIAAGIPVASAVFGIMIGLGLIGVTAGFADVPSISPMLATMIGIGVGIDYALFVVTRHRGFLHRGIDPVESAALANATSGTAVLFAGTTVVVAIAGLWIAGIPSITAMGLTSAITVAVAMVAAVTLLPALLGLAGHRIDRWKIGRRARAEHGDARATVSGRWADHVGRHPWRYAIGSFVVLAALAAPVMAMRTGMADDGTAAADTTYRRAYDMVADGFGAGFNGPLTVVLDGITEDGGTSAVDAAVTARVAAAIAATPDVAVVAPPVVNEAGDTAVLTVVPVTGPQDAATADLVAALRDEVLPATLQDGSVDAVVTGQTAGYIDISERLGSRLPLFILAVVGVSFLLLMVVFRSVLVPLKAAVMNLLSIGAAYGVVVAVFQWGWGAGLMGVHQTVPISPFLPMIMFAILFGLSMDYEVFLLSRVREEWVRTGDSHRSVVDGLAATARVITSAALIMISVFAAFLLAPDIEIKMFAVGLSAAIAIDASIVRMVFVPSSMALMGDANWWLPRWLDRVLPRIDVEGATVVEAIEIPDDISGLESDEPERELVAG
jgi:RND superfamily putative drug exporter